MTLSTAGDVIVLYEKHLVPGDYKHYEILYETDVWQGDPVKREPPAIPLQVQAKGVEFGGDPHKATLNKISAALGSLMEKKMGAVIPNKDLMSRRDWR